MSNNRNERANKYQGRHEESRVPDSQQKRHESNFIQSNNTRESSQQPTMNTKNHMPKPVDNPKASKDNHVENSPKPKPTPEQTGEKEGRDSSNKDTDHSRPETENKQEQTIATDREQASHTDREHDSFHDDKPSQPSKPVGKPSQPSVASLPKPRKAKNHDSFYLGLASAVLVAALGLSLSTMPIFFSLPLAAVLFGIGIWLLSYASFKSPGKPEGEGTDTDRHTRTVVVATVLLVLQTFIMDVFIFTRMGTVGKHQNAIVIAWIIASMIETLAAFALIYHHNPLQSKPKDSAANDKHEGKE